MTKRLSDPFLFSVINTKLGLYNIIYCGNPKLFFYRLGESGYARYTICDRDSSAFQMESQKEAGCIYINLKEINSVAF